MINVSDMHLYLRFYYHLENKHNFKRMSEIYHILVWLKVH